MCVLTGYITSNQEKSKLHTIKQISRLLLWLSETGGKDSLGVASISSKLDICKIAIPPRQALQTTEFNNFWKDKVTSKTRIFIGHTRYATHGKVKVLNTHPFRINSIVGAHNGVLDNYTVIADKYSLSTQSYTDSEIAIALLEKHKMDWNYIKELEGSIALTVVDITQPSTLYIYRDDNTNLSYSYVKELNTLFWNSNRNFLETAFFAFNVSAPIKDFEFNMLNVINADKPSVFTSKELIHRTRVYELPFGDKKYSATDNWIDDNCNGATCAICGQKSADAWFDFSINGYRCWRCWETAAFGSSGHTAFTKKQAKKFRNNTKRNYKLIGSQYE